MINIKFNLIHYTIQQEKNLFYRKSVNLEYVSPIEKKTNKQNFVKQIHSCFNKNLNKQTEYTINKRNIIFKIIFINLFPM